MSVQDPTTRRNEMFAVIENYLASGLTQKEFSNQLNLAINTFQYWLKKYREQNEPSEKNAFLPLRVNTRHNNFACVLEFPNGIKIHWREIPEMTVLRSLLRLK